MKVLITGANGFVGKNLQLQLLERKAVQVVCYTRSNQVAELVTLLHGIDFVFHLAGVNRPQDPAEFISGNVDLTRALCQAVGEIAESTGKEGTGILPVVLDVVSPELSAGYADVQVLRLVDDAHEFHLLNRDKHEGEILVSGTLGAMFMVFEYATAVAGRLLGINPFDQPDVESAKIAARALLDNRPAPTEPLFTDKGIEVRAHGDLGDAKTVREAITAVLEQLPADGYVSVQAYVDRANYPQLHGVRDLVAARAGRPVTFGWGPRFLHSTGQFHKGGPAVGVFIQILQAPDGDVVIPERPFSFGQLIAAQAAGDANVLADHGRPVLTLTLTNPNTELEHLFAAFN